MKASQYDKDNLLKGLDIYQKTAFKKAMKLGSMCLFGDTDIFGDNFADFDEEFLVRDKRKKRKLNPRNTHLFQMILHEYSYRITKEEALDLPKMRIRAIPINLSGDAKTAYSQMLKEQMVRIKNEDISATMAFTVVTKLQQICSGFIYGENVRKFTAQDKIKKLLEILPKEKVVIFCKYNSEIEMIQKALKDRKILTYTGETKDKKIWRLFQETNEFDVFLANIKTGGTGLNLHSARKLIFYSQSYSYLDYYQARDRIYRRGQTRDVDIYCLYVKNSIEESIYQVLENKGKSAKAVLDDYRKRVK